METLLCLPFLLLILVLAINVGHGWIVQIRAEGAARFAGSVWAAEIEAGRDDRTARFHASEATRRFWYPDDDEAETRFGHDPATDPVSAFEREGESPGDTGSVFRNIASLVSGRQRSHVEMPRRPPTGTLLPPTPVRTHLSVDGNPWNHAVVPLTFDALTGVGEKDPLKDSSALGRVLGVVGYAGRAFFWLLGMVP
jgi:hypothetical protein